MVGLQIMQSSSSHNLIKGSLRVDEGASIEDDNILIPNITNPSLKKTDSINYINLEFQDLAAHQRSFT